MDFSTALQEMADLLSIAANTMKRLAMNERDQSSGDDAALFNEVASMAERLREISRALANGK